MNELGRAARRLKCCEIEDGPDDRAPAADRSRTGTPSAVARDGRQAGERGNAAPVNLTEFGQLGN